MKTSFLVGAICCAVVGVGQAITIDFENLAHGTVVNNQYAGVTFSSISGRDIVVDDFYQNMGNSLPNYAITAITGGDLAGTDPVFVNFSAPISGLSFLAIGDNDVGTVANVTVFVNGVSAAVVPIVADGEFTTPTLVDLSSYLNVTGITIGDVTDGGGLAYDDFNFNASGSVPDPSSTLLLLGCALAGIGGLRRRLSC